MSGGGGGGGYQYMPTFTSNNSSSTNAIPAWLTQASQTGVNYAGKLLNNPGQAYTGEIAPGMNADQTAAGNMVRNTIGAYQPYYNAATGLTAASANAAPDINAQTYANGLSNIGQYMNPYISNVVDSLKAQSAQNLDQSLKQTADQAIGAHAFGGSRHGVQEGVATAQNNLGLNNQIANLLSGGYSQATNLLGSDITNNLQAQGANQANANNALNRMQGAGSQLANIGTANRAANVADVANLMTYGGVQQQTQGAQDQAAYSEFLRQQQLPYQALQAYNQTVSSAPHDTTSNTSSSGWGMSPVQQPASSSPWMTGLGLGLAGASMLGTGGMSGLGGLLGSGLAMATGTGGPLPKGNFFG